MMGIPSYFVYLIKNYKSILKTCNKNIKIDNFYLDSNSIIYDAVHNINYESDNYENKIIDYVIKKLNFYINIINPINTIYIAFDGVAPIAKLEQQRNRRYKTWYTNNYLNINDENKWDTCAITPGTKFMNNLTKKIKDYFKNNKYKNANIIVSGTDDVGEGEHKIFNYIRDNYNKYIDSTTIIYGLDADLIMLTLLHLKYCNNLFLFRETPYFINNIDKTLVSNKMYVMDIYYLQEVIIDNMKYHENNLIESNIYNKYINDYIFLSFLLGNDFMPHFPSINIRTNGMDIILNIYKNKFSKENKFLTNNNDINWKNVRLLIQILSDLEEENLLNEIKKRDNLEKRFKHNKFKNDEEKLLNQPLTDRVVEKYINIGDEGWETRYYRELFDIEINDSEKQKICLNYLEGLEWNLKYYNSGCSNWRWYYKFNYAPLFKDLYNYVPFFNQSILSENKNGPVNIYTQLSYVLPRNSLKLLPENIFKKIVLNYEHCYRLNYEIKYSFCKYFWESHVILPDIDIEKLDKLVKDI
jgi:5'-3' exonuclease